MVDIDAYEMDNPVYCLFGRSDDDEPFSSSGDYDDDCRTTVGHRYYMSAIPECPVN